MASLPKEHPPVVEQFNFGDWSIATTRSHILCSEGPKRAEFVRSLSLPQLPEMIFAANQLSIEHCDGCGIYFKALDALQQVDSQHDLVKVAAAKAWREARSGSEHINEVVKPFDWTFTTDYKGTLLGKNEAQFRISETTEKIDLEKLKVHENILFYADVMLFEDELADNGCSMLNVKIRVMPSSFFVLQRFFLRVDGVLARINDTRIFHQVGTDYLLREYSSHEDAIDELEVTEAKLTNPAELVNELRVRSVRMEKLEFSASRVA